MYSYIVVDDELLIRKGLIRKVDSIVSEKLHCIGEAVNGAQGMELVREKNPDIVITDMKMNKMSGIEFLELLGEKYPEKPVIVISGYKDFNYVKKAIEKRVIGYVLKPFSVEEIEKQLLDAISRIQQKQNFVELKEKLYSFEQKRNQEVLRTVIMEPWNEMLEEVVRKKGYSVKDQFQMIVLYVQQNDPLQLIENISSNVLINERFLIFENPVYKKQYFILIHIDEKYKKKYPILIEKLMKEFHSQIKEGKVYSCFTDSPFKLDCLNKLYGQSEKQVRQIWIGMMNRSWKVDDKKIEEKRVYSEEQIQELFRNIKYHKNETKQIMEQFFEMLWKQTKLLQTIGSECKSLIQKVNEYAVQKNVETDDVMAVFYHRYLFCDDIEKMKNELSGYVTLIMNSIEMQENKQIDNLDRIEDYIKKNYHQKLTLQQISSHFYMTPASCSNLLKQKLGKSFNEYMSEIRIAKAKKLLLETDLSIENISEEIGYANPKYFFKVFKKMVLCTPLEFRNQGRD